MFMNSRIDTEHFVDHYDSIISNIKILLMLNEINHSGRSIIIHFSSNALVILFNIGLERYL